MTEKKNHIEEEKKNIPDGPRFTKDQVLASDRYRNKKDLVSALLDDGRMYTAVEVDQMIDRVMKGRVR